MLLGAREIPVVITAANSAPAHHLGTIININIVYYYSHIGYELQTFGEYMSVEFIYWYWIYPANY